ncbi:urease accessory protein UreD [Sporosarcina sp. Te-1]|uniref:urease accessory protein UreD n=1 Tax=Sporosarcina sp. Te-1 TaxID=2818390 RepID=UPI001FB123FD|nr:urease accessory protein UreD [Sporosarcina sp. Te-1]
MANKEQTRINHHGKLDLVFEPRRGYTRMPHVYQQPPLKASRELYTGKDPTATVYVMESSGGMVAGDRNDLTIRLLPDSQARIVQQSALKVYRSHTGVPCIQTIEVEVGARARMEWMPEVIIPFADAKFQMDTTIRLAKDATVLWGEIIAPGREKRGEVFEFESFKSNMRIYVEDVLLAMDSIHFVPKRMQLSQMGLLEASLYVGSVWLVSPAVESLDVRELQQELKLTNGLRVSMTRLDGNAIHCRFLGTEQWELQQEMKRVFQQLSSLITNGV